MRAPAHGRRDHRLLSSPLFFFVFFNPRISVTIQVYPIQISHSLTLDNHPDFDGDFGWRSIEEIAVGLRPSSDEEAWDRDSDSDEEELEEDEEVEH